MNAKITLYSNKELITKIKQYAKKHNISVSQLVNNFFEGLLEKEAKQEKLSDFFQSSPLKEISLERNKENYKSRIEF